MSSFAEQAVPFVAASVVAVGIALAGTTIVTPRYDAWQSELAAAQQAAAEARAQAEAEAAAAAEEERRQRAAQALSMSMGGGGAPSAAAQPGVGFNPLMPASTGGAASGGWDGPRAEEYGNLPDTDGVQTVYQNCTWCHSQSLFTQQKMTPDRWDYTLDWMVTSGGMPELPEEDRQVILDYLVRHYSS